MDEAKSNKPRRHKFKKIKLPFFGLAMFLLGALVLFAFRFATFESEDVHYHANFALYVNGQRDEFKSFTFYEEVTSCDVHDADDVAGRAHMHDKNPGLVHVHAPGVSWSQFFTNLGYTLGNKVVVTDGGVYADGQDGNKLTFVLNGQTVRSVQGRVIKSTDRLLISYGKEDAAVLEARSKALPNDADKANKTSDPAACSGSQDSSLTQRLKAAAGLRVH